MSHSHLPPVPPANRTDKGPADEAGQTETGSAPATDDRNRNLASQGRQGNIRQNTHHEGYQQDR